MMHKIEWDKTKFNTKIIYALCILLLIALSAYLVYKTGGTRYSFTHVMYVPIIIAAFTFDTKISILFALISGMALGPLMPLEVNSGIMQNLFVWGNRTFFFIVVSFTVSLMLGRIKKLNDVIQQQAYINAGTGLPNINKFELDMWKLIEGNPSVKFTLLTFEYGNMDEINRYVDGSIGRESIKYLIKNAVENFKGYSIYSIYLNEFVVVLPNVDLMQGYGKGMEFLQKFKELQYIEGIPINFVLKCAVVNFPSHGDDWKTILQRLGRTLDQVKNSNRNIGIFEDYLAKKSVENYNVLVNFYEAFNKGGLTLYYQPKIDIKSNKVFGVEALLRWKENGDKRANISNMIKIVENSGSISELTKWVTEKAVKQLKEWHGIGLNINVSVNISAKDLMDNSIVNHMKDLIETYELDSRYFEYELTERTIIDNDGKSSDFLNEFKDMGLTLSIDDYGTGYNSLMNMLNLPLDYIKIDKYFIDNIVEIQNMKLIQDIIDLIHNLGKKVCAEGVETKEQLDILNEIGCDYVQGYYFSKAIPPGEVEKFVRHFNNI